MAAELSDVYVLSDDYISVSVSKKNGGFTIRTVEGDRLKKSDNDKDLLYHDGQYDTSFLSVKDKYSMFLGGNQSLCVVRTPHTDAPKLLIIRDS